MAYISPFHIISYFNPEVSVDEVINFSRLQKKIIAEFNLTQASVITIHGTDYSKDQVIKILDGLLGDQFLPMHRIIYNVPAVLEFLERPTGQPDKEVLRLFFKFNESSGYFSFFKKQFQEAMLYHLKHHLSLNNYLIVSSSKDFLEEIIPEAKTEISNLIYERFVNLRAYIQSLLYMGNRSDYMENKIREDFSFIYREKFPEFVDALSWEFDDIVLKLWKDLLRFIQYCNKNYIISIDLLLKISYALERVNKIDTQTNEQIRNFSRFLEAESKTDPSPFFEKEYIIERKVERSFGQKIFTGVVLTLMIVIFIHSFISDEKKIRDVDRLMSASLLVVVIMYEISIRNKYP